MPRNQAASQAPAAYLTPRAGSIMLHDGADQPGETLDLCGPPRMGIPAAEPWDGEVLVGEPGLRAIGFKEHASALAHFLRATNWFAASEGGALFVGGDEGETTYRYIDVGIES